MLGIGLLTRDRSELTAMTLGSFAALHPDLSHAKLYHWDDGSIDGRNQSIAQAYGFSSAGCGRPEGQMNGVRFLAQAALLGGCDSFMLLENDWRWVRPLGELPSVPAAVDCIRLYGEFKDAEQKRPARRMQLAGLKELGWAPSAVGPGWEEAYAHWGGPPSIVQLKRLMPALQGAQNLKAVSLRSMDFLTIRPKENFVFHIGHHQTEDFRA